MDQPLHDLRPFRVGHSPTHRFLSIGFVVLLHVVAIWALATGLIQNLASHLPGELKADVIPPKEQNKPPPPPPPPELQKPPPPFVPPPEISIENNAPTNTITVQSKVATPPPPPQPHVVAPPKPAGISAPVALKAAHECNSRYYPPIAQRLDQHGTTVLRLTVTADGHVTDAKVADSSGYDALDQAAIRCVTSGSWGAYRPAMQNGQPIEAQTEVKIVWQPQ